MTDPNFLETRKRLQLDSVERFVGISAFVYAMDFARWLMQQKFASVKSNFVLQFPNPSIASMRLACDSVCSLPLLESLFQQHPYTSSREASGRCFDVCYIAEILSLLLNGRHEERIVHFLFEARGSELEWTLGYYLKHHITGVSNERDSNDDKIGIREEL